MCVCIHKKLTIICKKDKNYKLKNLIEKIPLRKSKC